MINFEISAPCKLSLFGDYASNGIISCMDLRTKLAFTELQKSENIELRFPKKIQKLNAILPIQKFHEIHNRVRRTDIMDKHVLKLIKDHTSDCDKLAQAFYFLVIYMSHKEQIQIKPCRIRISPPNLNEEFVCPTSFTVCLVACLLHWSHVQKGNRRKQISYNSFDLEKIASYAALCKEFFPESGLIETSACTYGSIIHYKIDNTIAETDRIITMLFLSHVTILLVDSKHTQNLEVQKQQVAELTNKNPEIAYPILNNINIITNMACDTIQKLNDIYEQFDIEVRNNCLLQEHKNLEISIRENRKFLRLLIESQENLEKIYAIAEKYGFSGKYTNIDNNKLYAYIWIPSIPKVPTDITFLSNELFINGFTVTTTKLESDGVQVDNV